MLQPSVKPLVTGVKKELIMPADRLDCLLAVVMDLLFPFRFRVDQNTFFIVFNFFDVYPLQSQ